MKFLKNNKGLTLVELLIGVAILGIIVAPLLNSFAVSARTATKSREIGEATNVAQNISEMLQGNELELITNGSTLLGGQVDNVTGIDPLTGTTDNIVIDVSDIDNGDSTFDARVTLTAGDVAVEGNYDTILDANSITWGNTVFETINMQDVVNYDNMDAMFSQLKFITNEELGIGTSGDVTNIADIANSQDPDLMSYYDALKVAEGMVDDGDSIYLGDKINEDTGYYEKGWKDEVVQRDRRIVINIYSASDTEKLLNADITYEYEFTFTTQNGEKITLNADTNPIECKRTMTLFQTPYDYSVRYPTIYILYHAYYKPGSTPGSIDEIITINNNIDETGLTNPQRLPVNLYIIKQKNPNGDRLFGTFKDDENYRAQIQLVQSYQANENTDYMMIYSNAGEGHTTPLDPEFRYYNGLGAYYPTNWEEAPVTLDPSATPPTSSNLQKSEQQYRMYNVQIDILDDDDNTDVIFSLQSSKLA